MKVPQNQYKIKAENQHKLESSIRMIQYINMYNLKHDQIAYQCPIYKSNFIDESEDFDIEVLCVQEMADVQILYKAERKQQFEKIRKQEQLILEKIKKQEEQEMKKKGFFGKLFGSKSKPKINSSSLSPTKTKIDDSALKSSFYAKKNQQDESSLLKSKMNLSSLSRLKHSQSIVIPVQIVPTQNTSPQTHQQTKNKTQVVQSPINNLKKEQEESAERPNKMSKKIGKQVPSQQKPRQSKAFQQQELVQIDLDDLLDVNQSKEAEKIDMPEILEEESEAQSSRESKVSRVSLKDLEESFKKQTSRISKRSHKRIDSDEEQQKLKGEQKKIQNTAMKKKINPSQQQPKPNSYNTISKPQKNQGKQKQIKNKNSLESKNKSSQKVQTKNKNKGKKKELKDQLNKKKSKEKLRQKEIEIKQQKSNKREQDLKQDKLSSYIESQLSRLTVSRKQNEGQQSGIQELLESLHQSLTTPNKSQSSLKSLKSQKKQKSQSAIRNVDDSFSDVKINWMVKIESCDLQQKLLLNRLKQRWVQPFRNLDKVMAIRLQQITPEINRDPRLNWSKPNLNFAKIIQ